MQDPVSYTHLDVYKRQENGLPLQKNDEIGGKHLNSEDYLMQMDGQGVFRFAIKQVPEVIQEVLEKNEVKPEEIDWYILHQANRRILEACLLYTSRCV